MGDRRYNSDDIAKAVNEGDANKVRSEINSDYLRMSSGEFSNVIRNMESTANANSDASHHATVERDKDGNISAIYVSNEALGFNYWNSKVFDKNDLPKDDSKQANLGNIWGRLTRTLPGALDQGKE